MYRRYASRLTKQNHNKIMIEYYKKRAKEYDLVYQKEERQKDLLFLSDYLKNAFLGLDVLDVGCGTGYWSEKIATTAHSIHGIDINITVLDIAKSRNYHSTPFSFQELSYHDLNKIPQRFSGISCGFVWSHIYKNDHTLFIDLCLKLSRVYPLGFIPDSILCIVLTDIPDFQ
jgi:2-polyprenyl-3-methyl-5-hydroxy-6-metoxy-1,4-benzoquinol methylase